MRRFVDDAEVFLHGSADPIARALGGNPDWETQTLAAFGAVRHSRTPDDLVMVHAIATRYLSQSYFRELVANSLSDIVTTTWLDLCDQPALLVTPRLGRTPSGNR